MRAFTGIDLPDALKVSISAMQARMPQGGITAVRQEAMHITLHFFESITERQAQMVIDAISSARPGPFEARVIGLSYFGGRDARVVFANVEDREGTIYMLYEQIGRKLLERGIHYDRKEKFIPHITIARCRSSNPLLKKFIEDNYEYDFGSLTVGSVFLKKSALSGSGPVYTTLYEHQV